MTAAARPRLRVVHVVLNLHEGGLERMVVDLASGVSPDEFDVHVVCLQREGMLADELPPNRVSLVPSGRGARAMLFPRALARHLALMKPDVLHLHSGVWFKAARAASLAGLPGVVFTDHGRPWPDPLAARLADRGGALWTNRVVAVSSGLRDYLLAELRLPREQVVVIRNAVRTRPRVTPEERADARRQLGFAPDTPVIGSVGRLVTVKAYDVLIRAVKQLRATWRGAELPRLVIVGDGPERARLEAVVAEEQLEGAVSLVGWQRDARRYLAMMDAFVLSSDSEGTSVSLLEAMQAGVPVVATAVGGNADVLGPALAQQLVPPQHPEALADRLRLSLATPEARHALADAGCSRVASDFSERRMLSEYEQLYREVAATVDTSLRTS